MYVIGQLSLFPGLDLYDETLLKAGGQMGQREMCHSALRLCSPKMGQTLFWGGPDVVLLRVGIPRNYHGDVSLKTKTSLIL